MLTHVLRHFQKFANKENRAIVFGGLITIMIELGYNHYISQLLVILSSGSLHLTSFVCMKIVVTNGSNYFFFESFSHTRYLLTNTQWSIWNHQHLRYPADDTNNIPMDEAPTLYLTCHTHLVPLTTRLRSFLDHLLLH